MSAEDWVGAISATTVFLFVAWCMLDLWRTREKQREPSMAEAGVKVEVVEPKVRFSIVRDYGAGVNTYDFTESEARAIYGGLAVHFGDPWSTTFEKKDAEIGRLKAEGALLRKRAEGLVAEDARLRDWMLYWKRNLAVFGGGRNEIDSALEGFSAPESQIKIR
jgi:hypothetical protein